MTDSELCVRCDEPVPVAEVGSYVSLTFGHETGCLPIHRDCFEEVRGRDLWQ